MHFRIIILAAGKGKRMGNGDKPKALTPVGGKPILQYLVESIESSKVDGVPVVVTGPEKIRLCDEFGGRCDYVSQMEQLGTGHAVMVSKDMVIDSDALIVLYGDHPFISANTLKRLTARHAFGDNTITMMTTTVPSFDDWYSAFTHWGRILREPQSGHIIGIREYKDTNDQERGIKEVNPALFCFDSTWLWENIEKLNNNNAQQEYYLTDLIEMAVEQGKRISSLDVAPEEAIGINTPQECKVAEDLIEKFANKK
ncbi:MAG: NTP transferase domain-containing protein [Patescibacteria group bacterium]